MVLDLNFMLISANADDATTYRVFYPDISAYILSKPARHDRGR